MSNWYQGLKSAHSDAVGCEAFLVVLAAPILLVGWITGGFGTSPPPPRPAPVPVVQVAPVVSETKREKAAKLLDKAARAWQGWRGEGK